MVKVTIVVAIYNVSSYLEKCLQSIICQTYENIEIILINDGSLDDSVSICKEFALKDERIKVIDQQNQGVSAVRNNGIDISAGDYIMFVDGDDCLQENITEELVNNVDNYDIIACSYKAFDEGKAVMQDCHFFNGDRDFSKDRTDLYLQLINLSYGQTGDFYTAIGVPWGKLYKRSFLEKHKLRFNTELIRMQDNIFNMQAFCLADKIKYIDKSLYMYRLNNILAYKKLPYHPDYLKKILHERERIIKKFALYKNELIMNSFKEEILLSELKTIIYVSRTEKFANFKKTVHAYLDDDIYAAYKDKRFFISKRAFVISVYMKMGLNYFTYLAAKHVKF